MTIWPSLNNGKHGSCSWFISVITYTINFAIFGRRLRNCGTIHWHLCGEKHFDCEAIHIGKQCILVYQKGTKEVIMSANLRISEVRLNRQTGRLSCKKQTVVYIQLPLTVPRVCQLITVFLFYKSFIFYFYVAIYLSWQTMVILKTHVMAALGWSIVKRQISFSPWLYYVVRHCLVQWAYL